MKCYKLTDEKGRTRGGTQWGPGVTHEAPGTGELCSSGWIHCYDSPLVAVLMNPIHANIANPRLWECEADGAALDDHGLKRGVQRLTTVREMPLPAVTTEHRVRFAILCASRVCDDPAWLAWSAGWMANEDRSEAAARAAWAAAAAAAAGAAEAAWAAAAAAAAGAAAWAAAWAAAAAAWAANLDLCAISEEAMA